MKQIFATLVAFSLPFAVNAGSLTDVIDDYVVAFDEQALDADEQAAILAIHERTEIAHGMKLLLVHDVLLKAGALEHVNTHSVTPEPFEMTMSDQ